MENWISQVFLSVGITSITSTLAYMVVGLYWRMNKNKNPYLIKSLVKISVILALVPIAFIGMYIGYIEYRDAGWILKGDFLVGTPKKFRMIYNNLGIVWLIGAIIRLGDVLKDEFCLKLSLRGNVPIDNEACIRIFEYYRKEYGKRSLKCKQAEVVQNDLFKSPFSAGISKPIIVLPFVKYTEKQLHMIFRHEFYHIQARDLVWKRLSVVIGWIHWFNPVMKRIHNAMVFMEEVVCDCESNTDNKYFTSKEYGEFVSNLKDNDRISSSMTALCGSSDMMYWRIKIMLNTKNNKSIKKGFNFFAALMLALVTVLPSGVIAVVAGEIQNDLIYCTEKKEEIKDNLTKELLAEEDTDVVEIELNPGISMLTATVSIDYTIPKQTRILYSYKYMEAGESISIVANCDDSSVLYWIGIKDRDTGDIVYMEGTGSMAYSFPISTSGYYSAFVHNKSSKTMTVEGTAYYYN